jgi:uncharacterized membrane protein YbhN (UPF0104 family)
MRINKKSAFLFRGLTGLTVLILAVSFFDFNSVWTRIIKADLRYVIPAFICGLTTVVLTSVKLFVCLGYITEIPFKKVLTAIVSGKVLGYFAPGTLGADLGVIISLKSPETKILNITGIVIIDRVLSLFSIVLLIGLLLPFSYSRMPLLIQHFIPIFLSLLLLITIILLISFRFSPDYLKLLFIDKIDTWSSHPLMKFPVLVYKKWKRTIAIVLLSIILNICIQCGVYFLLHSVFLKTDFFYTLAVLPLNSFLIMIPLSVMGIGLREGGFYYLLSPFSVTMEDVIAFNMIGYFFEFIIIIISGFFMMVETFLKMSKNRKKSFEI